MDEGERLTTNFASSRSLAVFTAAGGNVTCPAPCAAYETCDDCFKGQCMWCPTVRKCIALDTYLINFPYGQCQTWITSNTYASRRNVCQQGKCWTVGDLSIIFFFTSVQLFLLDPSDCSKQKTCLDCLGISPGCGWCDDGSGTGIGECIPGSATGPNNASLCPDRSWFFTNCSG